MNVCERAVARIKDAIWSMFTNYEYRSRIHNCMYIHYGVFKLNLYPT